MSAAAKRLRNLAQRVTEAGREDTGGDPPYFFKAEFRDTPPEREGMPGEVVFYRSGRACWFCRASGKWEFLEELPPRPMMAPEYAGRASEQPDPLDAARREALEEALLAADRVPWSGNLRHAILAEIRALIDKEPQP